MPAAITTSTPAIRSSALRSAGMQLDGTVRQAAVGMKPVDEQELVVDSRSEGKFKVRLSRNDAYFEIRDSRDNLVLTGRNSDTIRSHSVMLSSGRYRLRVVEEDESENNEAYRLDLTPEPAPRAAVVERTGTRIEGRTEAEGARGHPADTQLFTVAQAGEYNIRLNTPLASYEIRNSQGKVVSQGHTSLNPESVKAQLVPTETYTLTVTQDSRTAQKRAYSVDIAPRINANIVGTSGLVMGNMAALPGGLSNVQTHTVNFLTDGKYSLNFLMPNAGFKLTDPTGKEVASGHNSATEPALPVDADLKAGAYTLAVELGPTSSGGNWLMTVRGESPYQEKTRLTAVEETLQQRDQRLRNEAAAPVRQQWTPQSTTTRPTVNLLA